VTDGQENSDLTDPKWLGQLSDGHYGLILGKPNKAVLLRVEITADKKYNLRFKDGSALIKDEKNLLKKDDPFMKKYTYVSAGYVKFIEQTGAQVVIINYTLPWEEIKRIMDHLDGVLLPGGWTDLF
jgi:hypothetical protein